MTLYEMYQEKLGKRNGRKVANNTYCERKENGTIAIRLHSTDVITCHADGRVVYNSGGWRTVTTKDRFNSFGMGGVRVYSNKGTWFLYVDNREGVPFADGITVHNDGRVTGEGEDPKADSKLRRKIQAYAKAYVDAFCEGKIDKPSNGDCWYCLMTVESPAKYKGKGLGEATRQKDHILSHIEEKYFVPSLLVRVMNCGRSYLSKAAGWYIRGVWQGEKEKVACFEDVARMQIRRGLTRYCYGKLGLSGM